MVKWEEWTEAYELLWNNYCLITVVDKHGENSFVRKYRSLWLQLSLEYP